MNARFQRRRRRGVPGACARRQQRQRRGAPRGTGGDEARVGLDDVERSRCRGARRSQRPFPEGFFFWIPDKIHPRLPPGGPGRGREAPGRPPGGSGGAGRPPRFGDPFGVGELPSQASEEAARAPDEAARAPEAAARAAEVAGEHRRAALAAFLSSNARALDREIAEEHPLPAYPWLWWESGMVLAGF